MKTYILIILVPFLLCFSGFAASQVEPEEEIIITKPEVDSANIDTFYDELSKDGEWIKVENDEIDNEEVLEMSETVEIDEDIITGYVWRPSISITLVDWNPYHYGHWEFCRFGWIWVSDYSWGWGPYHYGRWWYSHRWGWVWSPGHRWAPSWVSWCHTRHHVGWHPISPRTHWRHHNGIIVTHPRTPKQKGITNKWTFVSKKDFTNQITKHNTIDLRNDKNLVSDAKMNYKSDELYNLGPKKSDIENNTNTKISTKKVNVTNLNGKPINEAGTKKYEKKISTAKNNNYSSEKKKSTEKNNNTSTKKKQDNPYKSGNNGNYDNGSNKNSNTRKDNGNTNTRKDNGNTNTRKDNGNTNTRKDNGNTNTRKDNGSNKNTNTNKSGNTKKSSSNDYNWNSGSTKNSETKKSSNTYKSSETKKSSNTYKSNDSYKSNNSNSNNSYKSNNSNSNNSYKSSNSHSSNNNSSYKSGNSNSSNHNSSNNTNKSSNNSGNNNSGNKKK